MAEPELRALERRLVDLGHALELPPTPDLAAAVLPRLASAPRRPRRRLRLALAVAVLVLVPAAVALALAPSVRNAVLEVLGLRGARVERVATTPRPAAPPLPAGAGKRVSLAEAEMRVRFRVLLPAGLGRPVAVYLASDVPGGAVTLVYPPGRGLPALRPGLGAVLTELRGDLVPEFVEKMVPPSVPVRQVRVRGQRGLWIGGPAHAVVYRTRSGLVRQAPYRPAGPTLLWEHGALLVRLESGLGERAALRLARALR